MKALNKVISMFISALMLITSVPTQVFAQKAPITRFRNNPGLFERMIQDGYTQGYESFAEVYIMMPNTENRILFPVSKRKDEWHILRSGENADPLSKQWDNLLKESPYLPDNYVMKEHKIVRLNKSLKVRDGSSLPAGTYLDMTDDFFTVCTREQIAEDFIAIEKNMADQIPAFTQEKLDLILFHDKNGRFFGPADTYATYSRVQAVQTKGGNFILTNPNDKQYIVDGAKFANEYEEAAELGEDWFKPKSGTQRFRQLKTDMKIITPQGEEQILKKGSYVNVTDMMNAYGIPEQEFKDTFKSIRTLYQENLNGIQRFVSKIEERLAARHPKYEGVFFRRFLRNDTEFMQDALDKAAKNAAEKIEKAEAKRIAKIEKEEAKRIAKGTKGGTKRVINRTALKTFGGIVGVGLCLGFTLWAAPRVEAQNVGVQKTRNQVISELQAEWEANAEKKDLFEKMRSFINSDYAAVVITDAVNGDGELLDEMGSIMPTIEATGMTEEEAADILIDAAAEVEQEARRSEWVATKMANQINKPYSAPPLPDMLP